MATNKDNLIFEKTSFLHGTNSLFIKELYSKYLNDPKSVPQSWMEFFDGLDEDRDDVTGRAVQDILDQNGIEFLMTHVHTPFSSYALASNPSSPPLKVVLRDRVIEPTVRSVEEVTDLYARYRKTPRLVRFHVLESHLDAYHALDLPGKLKSV